MDQYFVKIQTGELLSYRFSIHLHLHIQNKNNRIVFIIYGMTRAMHQSHLPGTNGGYQSVSDCNSYDPHTGNIAEVNAPTVYTA